MCKCKNITNECWEQIFTKYDILRKIEEEGFFEISAKQIKEFREPRLMTKFDYSVHRPKIFVNNRLSILPKSRNGYIISDFDAYHRLEEFDHDDSEIVHLEVPEHIQSLSFNDVRSESLALNRAFVSGILGDFLNEEVIFPTVSGRMGTGAFEFDVRTIKNNDWSHFVCEKVQMEIDAGYEGIDSLALFEAKLDLPEDFIIRQLYYPYRVWKDRIVKPVRTVFLVYSNDVYNVYEYKFSDPEKYNSIQLVQKKKYSLEDVKMTSDDVCRVLSDTRILDEPRIAFPQANSFDRIINLCELLEKKSLDRNKVTERYAFDERQTNYYTDAACYLELIDKRRTESGTPFYELSKKGKQILTKGYKERQLAFCRQILSHGVFAETLGLYFKTGVMPTNDEIVKVMKRSNLYNIESEKTYERRMSTVKSWVNWIIKLINA